MNTLLADPPAVSNAEQPPSPQTQGATPESFAAPQRTCSNCGSSMDGAQDWCLQCGAGAPGSLATGGPSWRSAATILGATAILALGAAAAAYAALSNAGARKARPALTTVAQNPTTAIPPASTPITPGALTSTPKGPGIPTTIKPALPLSTGKPPKIPLTTPTPKSSGTTTAPSNSGGTTTPSTTTNKSSGSLTTTTEQQPTSILFDTNAAGTYNPYGYPVSRFGDPSLAIDGDASTGWTAQVDPIVAPKMAEGLVVDLKTARRLSALALITSTPGMTVQVYGANGHTLPASITDPTWVPLSSAQVVKKRKVRIKLQDPVKVFRFVTLWISRAPAASIGTAQAPGYVSLNEIELFSAK